MTSRTFAAAAAAPDLPRAPQRDPGQERIGVFTGLPLRDRLAEAALKLATRIPVSRQLLDDVATL